VARRLQHALRSDDVVARLGGDEFIVLITGTRSSDAVSGIAASIMAVLGDELVIDGQPMTVGASIGISQFPADGTSAEELLLNADAAMYAAKSGGQCAWLRYQDLPDAQKLRPAANATGEVQGRATTSTQGTNADLML